MPPIHRILVIEDNLDAAESLRIFLELSGHTVTVAHTGEDGLKRAEEFDPSVVLCDLGLPAGMNGLAVGRALRERYGKRTHLVALTGHGGADVARDVLEAGFDRHVVKPADPTVLRKMIEQI